MSVADLRNAHHALGLVSVSQKYFDIALFHGSSIYYYLRLGISFSTSPAFWQQSIGKVSENIPNHERYKLIMVVAMMVSTCRQPF